MENLLAGLVILAAVFAADLALAQEAPPPIAGKGYTLKENWDFGEIIKTREELRDKFWFRYVYNEGRTDYLKGNGEWQRYRDDNHTLTDKSLLLTAKLEGSLEPAGITSGMIRSKWTGKYGYFECRIKVPKGRALWPACWLNPEDKTWPPEIDLVEILDNGRDTTRRSFHGLNVGTADKMETLFTRLNKHNALEPGVDYADDFHVFATEWTPTLVRHYVDNVLVAERTIAWKHNDGTDGGPAHFLVNLAVGGKWPGAPTDPRVFPANLEVDYIRVWQRTAP